MTLRMPRQLVTLKVTKLLPNAIPRATATSLLLLALAGCQSASVVAGSPPLPTELLGAQPLAAAAPSDALPTGAPAPGPLLPAVQVRGRALRKGLAFADAAVTVRTLGAGRRSVGEGQTGPDGTYDLTVREALRPGQVLQIEASAGRQRLATLVAAPGGGGTYSLAQLQAGTLDEASTLAILLLNQQLDGAGGLEGQAAAAVLAAFDTVRVAATRLLSTAGDAFAEAVAAALTTEGPAPLPPDLRQQLEALPAFADLQAALKAADNQLAGARPTNDQPKAPDAGTRRSGGGSGDREVSDPLAALAIEERATPLDGWSLGPSLVRPRAGLAAGAAGDRLIAYDGSFPASYEGLAAGADGWQLDTSQDTFEAAQGSEAPRQSGGYLAAAHVDESGLWVGGGRGFETQLVLVTADGPGYFLTAEDFYVLVPVTAAVGAVFNGAFYVAGGYDGDNFSVAERPSDSVVAHGLEATPRAPLPVAVAGAASVVLDGRWYVLGGQAPGVSGRATPQAVVQIYDPQADAWTASTSGAPDAPASLPVACHSAAAAVLDGRIYLVGGFGADGAVLGDLWVFDPASGVWTAGPRLPTPRALLALAAFQGGLWAIGGIGEDHRPTTTVEVLRP